MNSTTLTALLGLDCIALDAPGATAMLATPFTFADGDPVPIFVHADGGTVRFFDDGGVFMHFRGRGLPLASRGQARFIAKAAARHGVTWRDDGVLETMAADKASAPDAFRRYMAALGDICSWELDNEGANDDADLLIEDVALALRAARPDAHIERGPAFTGISGKQRTLALRVDGTAVAVTSTHHAAVSAALMAMVDIRQAPDNQQQDFLFIIADQQDLERAKQDAAILQAVAPVQLLSNLQPNSPGARVH